jgi:hypothetical protein
MMNAHGHRPGAGAAALSGTVATPSSGTAEGGTPGYYAESTGVRLGAAGSVDDGTAQPAASTDVPREVADVIWREAFMPTRNGGHVARPPVDICHRLRLFYRVAVGREQVAAVVTHRRYRAAESSSELPQVGGQE